MDVNLHPGIAALVLIILAWFVHRATSPCKCCNHSSSYDSDDFTNKD